MNLVESVIINLILILFPIIIYFLYCCCFAINKNKYFDIVLSLMLFFSLYLFFKYGNCIDNSKILLFSNIPIIIAYMKNNSKLAIVLSLFVVFYCYYVFNYNVIIMAVKFVFYFFVYLFVSNKKIENKDFITLIVVVQGFFLSFEYFFDKYVDLYNILELIMFVFIFYVITFIILYLFNFVDKLTSLYYEVKNLEKEKEIKNSLFKLTHEIKNPIAVCKGYLDMMDIDDKKKTLRYVDIIKQEINRCLNITSDFLEFSRIKINKDLIDVGILLDDVYDSFKILNKYNNIKFNYVENDNEIYIDGDYDRLKQVLINLIKNSMEAINDNGVITISSKFNKNCCYIIIEDNGVGMDDETLNNIKDLFYTTKSFGSGIGVSLSNEIIKAHGGCLNYYSSLGNGTRVEIIIPKEI